MASCFKYKDGWRVQINIGGKRDSATFRTKREALAWGHQAEHKIRAAMEIRRDLERRLGVREGKDSAQEIIDKQFPVSSGPGTYILFNNGLVSYVGKSMNMLARIASHSGNGRTFTHFYTIPCLPDEIDKQEAYYIQLLDPYENKALKCGAFRDKKLQHEIFKDAEVAARAEQRQEATP